jgi:CRP-like cAMP-binding protein
MKAGERHIKTVKKSDVFGEVALFDKAPRSCEVAAVEASGIWALNGNIFKKTLS